MQDYSVTFAGHTFRPISAFTLTFLAEIRSPFITGGDVSPLDFALFAWAHGAPLPDVLEHLDAGTYSRAALEWSATVPPEVFAVYTPRKMQALANTLAQFFADKKSGFVPFPAASRSKRRWSVRALISSMAAFLTGSPSPSTPASATTAT